MVELMIYIYMFVCVSLIVFNAVYMLIMKQVNKNIEKNCGNYDERISEQIDRIHNGLEVTKQHKKYLYKKLKKTSHLTAFDRSLENIYQKNNAEATQYILEIYSVFMYLSCEYRKKDKIRTAYLPYVISKYNLLTAKRADFILDMLFELLHSENVYCRENALKALYSMGDCDNVINALKIIDRDEIFHHPKLITDGLMTFNGDKKKLADMMLAKLDTFSVDMKLNILNFIRFSGIRYDEKMLEMLSDEKENKEIRLAVIRYFEKFYYADALPLLYRFAKNDGEKKYDWEYQAISSSALKTYPGKETENILIQNMSNSNWYVRYNSAESCDSLGLTYSDLISVFDGTDRYAREMVKYRFDRKAVQKEVVMN